MCSSYNDKYMIKEGEYIDKIGFGGLRLIQKTSNFRYGLDAVLIADMASKGKPFESAVDLGTGTGVIPLILSHKTNARWIMGVELQKSSYACAVRNVEINGLLDRIDIFNTDVCESGALKAEIIERNKRKGILRDGYVDAVVSNPPYIQVADGMRSDNLEKMIARHELKATLGDFVNCAAMILKPKGDFYMVHRLTRMADIFCTLREHSLEPKELRLISSYKETAPNIMLIHAVKNGGNGLKILKNMCVYKEKGIYSDEIIDIYER